MKEEVHVKRLTEIKREIGKAPSQRRDLSTKRSHSLWGGGGLSTSEVREERRAGKESGTAETVCGEKRKLKKHVPVSRRLSKVQGL